MKDPAAAERAAELTEEELKAASGGQSQMGKALAIMKGLPYEVDPQDICDKYICKSCGHAGMGPADGRSCLFLAQFGSYMEEEEIHACSTCKYFHGQPAVNGWLNPTCHYFYENKPV